MEEPVELLTPTLIFAFALLVVWFLLRRSSEARKAALKDAGMPVGSRAGSKDREIVVHERPRPTVVAFHVRDDVAEVTFDVPLPAGGADEVMQELLVAEALEVVREKQHTLPITQVSKVTAFAGRGGDPVKVGTMELPTRGELPPPLVAAPQLHLGHVGFDPIDAQFEGDSEVPSTVTKSRSDTLGPIGGELRIPKAVEVGLRGQGIDPAEMDSGQLVAGLLRLFGYAVVDGGVPDTYTANKGGSVTFVRQVSHEADDSPELDEKDMRTFLVDFLSSKADRGLLVSDKYGPFSVYQMEKAEPRIQFVTRERLQKFIDALALN